MMVVVKIMMEEEEGITEVGGVVEVVDKEEEVLTELLKVFRIWSLQIEVVVEEVGEALIEVEEEVREMEVEIEGEEEVREVEIEGEEEQEPEEEMMIQSLTQFALNLNTCNQSKEKQEPSWHCLLTTLVSSRNQIPGCSSTGWISP